MVQFLAFKTFVTLSRTSTHMRTKFLGEEAVVRKQRGGSRIMSRSVLIK